MGFTEDFIKMYGAGMSLANILLLTFVLCNLSRMAEVLIDFRRFVPRCNKYTDLYKTLWGFTIRYAVRFIPICVWAIFEYAYLYHDATYMVGSIIFSENTATTLEPLINIVMMVYTVYGLAVGVAGFKALGFGEEHIETAPSITIERDTGSVEQNVVNIADYQFKRYGESSKDSSGDSAPVSEELRTGTYNRK